MGISLRPDGPDDREKARIRQNVDRMQQQGATPDEIEAYLRDYEGLRPSMEAASDASAVAPGNMDRRKDAQRERPIYDPVGLLSSVVNGAAMGAGPFMAASAAAAATGHNPFNPPKQLREEANQPLQEYRAANPVSNFLAELAGGALSAGVAGRVAGAGRAVSPAATMAQKAKGAAMGIGTAAGFGAVAGAGSGLNEGADLPEIASRAFKGGVAGGVFGTGLAGLGAAGRAVGLQNIIPRPATAASRTGKIAAKAGILSEQEMAANDLLRAFARDETTPEALASRLRSARPGETLLDLQDEVGTAVDDLAEGITNFSNRGGKQIAKSRGRAAELRPKVLKQEVGAAMGLSRGNTVDEANRLVQETRGNAGKLYPKAYEAPPVDDPKILDLFRSSHFQRAYKEASKLMKEESGRVLPPLQLPLDETEIADAVQALVAKGVPQDKATAAITKQVMASREIQPISVEAFDAVKQGMETYIEKASKRGTLDRKMARVLRTKLQGAMESVNADPRYADYLKARRTFAGDKAVEQAAESGQDFLKASRDELEVMWRGMSDAEKVAYRRSALASLEDQLGKVTEGRDPTLALRNDIVRDKLRVIAGDEAEGKLRETVDELHKAALRDNRLLGNSRTAARLSMREELNQPQEALTAFGNAITGNASGLLSGIQRLGVVKTARGLGERRADAVAPFLTAEGNDLMRMLEELAQVRAKTGQRQVTRRVVKGAVTGTAANKATGQ